MEIIAFRDPDVILGPYLVVNSTRPDRLEVRKKVQDNQPDACIFFSRQRRPFFCETDDCHRCVSHMSPKQARFALNPVHAPIPHRKSRKWGNSRLHRLGWETSAHWCR